MPVFSIRPLEQSLEGHLERTAAIGIPLHKMISDE